MKKQAKFLVTILLSIFLFSCKTEVEKKIIGTWVIDKTYSISENTDVFFRSNMITFKKKQLCILPRFDRSQNEKGTWQMDKENEDILHIKADNNPMQGIYHIDFETDNQEGLLKATLTSETYILNCSKLLHSPADKTNTD